MIEYIFQVKFLAEMGELLRAAGRTDLIVALILW